MKTATVSEIGKDFPAILRWVEAGEEVEVLREGKPVAVIAPPPRKVKHPDYLARLKGNFGEKILSSQDSDEIRDLNRGDR
jgi:antitoxin (DNA-binding transcriptional repressor) of toxin-antitoxin stability system